MLGWVDAKQDDARNGLAAAKDEIAEILVFRQEEAPFDLRARIMTNASLAAGATSAM